MDANENAEADQGNVEAVVVLPSGERINIRNMVLGDTLRFQQADGSTLAISFTVGEGGIAITVPAGGPVVNVRVQTGDADYHARREHIDLVRNGATEVDLTKPEWSRGNPDDIRSCQEELLSALEVDRTLTTVKVDHRFLANLEEMDRRRVFRVILDRPSLSTFGVRGSPKFSERIHTSALLETIVESHNHLQSIMLFNLRLKNQFEVEQLARALRACGEDFEN